MNSTHIIRQTENDHLNSLLKSNQQPISKVKCKTKSQAGINEDNISSYLNFSNSFQERECSGDLNQDPHIVQTKKENFIIIYHYLNYQYYQCGYCNRVFPQSQSLGGHIQKNHRVQQNQRANLSSTRLRTRHYQNSQN